MSKMIVDPRPATIHITFSEVTGQATGLLSRPLPFPLLVMIFCQLLIQWATLPPADNTPANAAGNPPALPFAKGGA